MKIKCKMIFLALNILENKSQKNKVQMAKKEIVFPF